MDKNRRSTSTSGSSASNDCLKCDRPPHQRRRWSILQILLSNILCSPQIIMKRKKLWSRSIQHMWEAWDSIPTIPSRIQRQKWATEHGACLCVCVCDGKGKRIQTKHAVKEKKNLTQFMTHTITHTHTHMRNWESNKIGVRPTTTTRPRPAEIHQVNLRVA